jgi:hypothetical protein
MNENYKIHKYNKVKNIENVYSKLDANGITKLEGHNSHLRLPGSRNIILENGLREEKRK